MEWLSSIELVEEKSEDDFADTGVGGSSTDGSMIRAFFRGHAIIAATNGFLGASALRHLTNLCSFNISS